MKNEKYYCERSGAYHLLLLSAFLCMALNFTLATSTLAQNEPSREIQKISLCKAGCEVIEFAEAISKVIVGDPEIADVTVTSPKHVLVTAKNLGFSSIVVWIGESDYRQFEVAVSEKRKKQQVMLQVRFSEVTRGALDELGAHFMLDQAGQDEEILGASFAGRVNTPQVNQLLEDNEHTKLNEDMLDDNVHFLFQILSKTPPYHKLTTLIRALEQKRALTTLAEPNLIAVNGETATFLAGGEFPVPIVQGTAGMQSVSILFKEFGVKLNFTPTILDSSTIRLKVEPEVSSLDFENGVVLSGFHIPSLLTRRAKTTIELKDGQAMIIGGLISREIIETMSRTPILGHMPILGNLFKSKRQNETENELIILIVPRIVEGMDPGVIESVKLEDK